MAGLLDFMNSPAGMGLLSAAAGGMATARRGTPWNNFGRAGIAGLTGYAQAQDDLQRQAQWAEAKKLRDLQMQQAEMQMGQMEAKNKFFSPENMAKFNKPPTPERTTFAAGPLFGQEALGMKPDFTPMTIPASEGGLDQKAYSDALLGSGVPDLVNEGLKMKTPKKPEYKIVEGNLVEIGNGAPKSVFTAPQKVDYNKPFLPDGTPNTPYQEYSFKNGRASASQVNNIMPKVETSARIQANEDFSKNVYRPVMDASKNNARLAAQLDAMDKLPISEKTGWGTNAKATAANVLVSLGMGNEQAKQYASDAQTFNSILNQQVWGMLAQQKGPQTEGDATRAKATYAQLENTPQANQFINDFQRAMLRKQNAEAAYYRKNYSKSLSGGDLSQMERDYMESPEGAKSLWDDPAMAKWKAYVDGKPQAPSGYGAPPAGAVRRVK